jgi:hypothetical protein
MLGEVRKARPLFPLEATLLVAVNVRPEATRVARNAWLLPPRTATIL